MSLTQIDVAIDTLVGKHGSGTLLRNDVVLTAKHVLDGSPRLIRVSQVPSYLDDDGSGSALAMLDSSGAPVVAMHPSEDVALVRHARPLTVAGSDGGLATPLSRATPPVGEVDQHVGWGAADSGCTGIDGFAPHAELTRVSDVLRATLIYDRSYLSDAAGSIGQAGDSGSSYRRSTLPNGNPAGVPDEIDGVLTRVEDGGGPEGNCRPRRALAVRSTRFVEWAHGVLSEWSAAVHDHVEDAADYEWGDPPGSTADSRWVAQDGALTEQADATDDGSESGDDSHAIHRRIAISNATVTVSIANLGAGYAGILARWINEWDYYEYRVDAGTQTASVVAVYHGVPTILGSAAFRATGGVHTLRLDLRGTTLVGFVDEHALIDVTDDRISAGKVGLSARTASKVRFDDLDVTPIAGAM
jgi:hypothetical protein